jgi:hypothetical protein
MADNVSSIRMRDKRRAVSDCRSGRGLISILHPCQVKTAALHSKPKMYDLPSASSAPNISACPSRSCNAGYSHNTYCGETEAHCYSKEHLWVEFKPIFCLWLKDPLSTMKLICVCLLKCHGQKQVTYVTQELNRVAQSYKSHNTPSQMPPAR